VPRHTAEPASTLETLTYSVPEAGRLMGISRNTAYEAARNGTLPTIRFGARYVVPRAALQRLLESGVKVNDLGKP
jgi:excisionase family DNA binding protein